MNETTTLPRLHLVWVHSELVWYAQTDTEHIYVEHALYDRYRREHFASLGLPSYAYTEYFAPAEQAWRRQCELEDSLRARGLPPSEIKQHLLSLGIHWQTWTEYMKPAEDAWNLQCEVEATLRAHLGFWKQVPGVRVVRKGEPVTYF